MVLKPNLERGCAAPFSFNSLLPSLFLAFIFIFSVFSSHLYDSKRLAQIALLTVAIFTIKETFILPRLYRFFFCIFIFIGLLTAFLNVNFFSSIHYFLHLLLLINFIFIGIKLAPDLSLIFLSISALNILFICCTLLNYSFYIFTNTAPTADEMIFGFNNIRFFNQMQVICIPILIYYFNSSQLKRLSIIFLTLNLAILLITGARGALISTLIILMFGFFLKIYSITALKKITFCMVIAIILFIMNSLYFSSNSSIEYTLRTTSSGRVEIWLDLISNLKFKNILIGNGVGAYKSEGFNVSHPHNSILQILYNWGAIVTAITLYLFYKLVINCLKTVPVKSNSSPYLSCFLSVIGMLTYSLVSGIIVMPIPQTFLFLFTGVLIYFSSPVKIILRKKKATYYITMPFIITLYLSLTFISYECKTDNFVGPNFWSNGQLSFEHCKLTYFEDQ